MDLDRLIRKVEAVTGCILTLTSEEDGPVLLVACDPDLDKIFSVPVVYPSRLQKAVRELHGVIYRAHSEEAYRRQEGKCAWCGEPLGGQWETDHIKRRSKGRSDEVWNLRCLHQSCHRERHQ